MFAHLPPVPSSIVPDLSALRDGHFGTTPELTPEQGHKVFLLRDGSRLKVATDGRQTVVAGSDVALLLERFGFQGFRVFEQRTVTETPFVHVPGLSTLNNLGQSGTSGMDGAFALLGKAATGGGQELVVVKRDTEGVWNVAYRNEVPGRSLCLSMESPERLWMVKTNSHITERHARRPSTLQEIALVKGALQVTKLKVSFPDSVVLAASAGGTFFFHDKTNDVVQVYDSGTKTAELAVPRGSKNHRYASAPDRFVVSGVPGTSGEDVGYIVGFRRDNGVFARWFEHQTPRVDALAISGDSVWLSGQNRNVSVACFD